MMFTSSTSLLTGYIDLQRQIIRGSNARGIPPRPGTYHQARHPSTECVKEERNDQMSTGRFPCKMNVKIQGYLENP
ncbi:Uncharacterized protein APZ42_000405 [Daphnia magna]|uniref:Uncharacterized protein n=1 Tax=Daphnia magna TaxID=35525 RepID=A0A164JPA5_9CRUS|nr:Uncharacterized protein APZ42_000405 [Daphnia magna]